MKKINLLLLFSIFTIGVFAQEEEKKEEFKPSGKAFGKVFWNYHYDLTKDADKASVFELNRSYFGYKYALSKNISTKITLDVGKNDAGSAYTAFLKTAQLDWKVVDQLKLSMGLIGMKQWNDQEKFYGYRYISKTIQDEHKFGTSADLGINAEIKLHEKIKINLLVVNGEGYKALQDDFGMHRFGGSIVVNPIDGLTLKAYYTTMPGKFDVNGDGSLIVDTAAINNLAFFAGYQIKDKFRIGAEYNKMINGTKYTNPAEDQELDGISVYSTFIINKKFEIFGRYDMLTSNKLEGATDNWNQANDGSAIIGGVQYTPVKGLKMALNYRNWMYADSNLDTESFIFVNFEYKF